MNIRKYSLAFSSLFVILLWGFIVVAFCYQYLTVLGGMSGEIKFTIAKYGTVLSLLLFHLTWAIATINQCLMAYAISSEVGDSYVNRLNTDYKYPLIFTVVDIVYIIFFSIKFGEYFV